MLMDLFVMPSRSVLNEEKAKRTVESSIRVVKQHYAAKSWSQINKTPKQSLFYGVAYDNEWFDPRLIDDIEAVLIYSSNVDMFSVFTAEGDGRVTFQPRIFSSTLQLNPDIKYQPLPFDHEKLTFEKLISGWLYVD